MRASFFYPCGNSRAYHWVLDFQSVYGVPVAGYSVWNRRNPHWCSWRADAEEGVLAGAASHGGGEHGHRALCAGLRLSHGGGLALFDADGRRGGDPFGIRAGNRAFVGIEKIPEGIALGMRR